MKTTAYYELIDFLDEMIKVKKASSLVCFSEEDLTTLCSLVMQVDALDNGDENFSDYLVSHHNIDLMKYLASALNKSSRDHLASKDLVIDFLKEKYLPYALKYARHLFEERLDIFDSEEYKEMQKADDLYHYGPISNYIKSNINSKEWNND